MKKVFKMLSVILSLYSINYCHGQVCGSLFPVKNIHPYSNQILIQDANKLINTYTTNPLSILDNTSNSFLFDAYSLFKFIYDKKSIVQDIQFLLAYDNNKKLQLYITALDINSNYITVGNTISDKDHDPDIRMCYIACTSTCGGGATIFGNGQFETSSDADATNAITSSTPNVQSGCGSVYFLPTRTSESKCSSQVTKKSANNYIKNFNNWMPVSEQTISFTFDAGTLINYLQYGTGFGIQDLHFILGRNSGTKQLDLIIGAIDVSGNHIYQIDGPGNLYVFEYCYPCPADCPGLSGRTTIMNKQSK